MELHCSEASQGKSFFDILGDETRLWFKERNLQLVELSKIKVQDADMLRQRLERMTASDGPSSITLAPVLFELAQNTTASLAERKSAIDRLIPILEENHAPATVHLVATLIKAYVLPAEEYLPYRKPRSADAEGLMALLNEPDLASDKHAQAALRLQIADVYASSGTDQQARAMLDAVVNSGLPLQDPFLQIAYKRLEAMALQLGDESSAQKYAKAATPSAWPCWVADSAPVYEQLGASWRDYPEEARHWHLSGWAMTEFDLGPEGTTANARVVIEYPPLILNGMALKRARDTRFHQTYHSFDKECSKKDLLDIFQVM